MFTDSRIKANASYSELCGIKSISRAIGEGERCMQLSGVPKTNQLNYSLVEHGGCCSETLMPRQLGAEYRFQSGSVVVNAVCNLRTATVRTTSVKLEHLSG